MTFRERIRRIVRKAPGGRRTLLFQYISLMTGIAVILIIAFSSWSYVAQSQQIEEQMLSEVRVLEKSIQATWDFIDYEQTNINRDSDGSYNFKGLYCSLVGKSVGKLFSMSTDYQYTLRYTRVDPRNALDEPDEFERVAFDRFYNEGEMEHYALVDSPEGGQSFRYVKAIYLTESCMSCHGKPAGEIDMTGFEKEGMDLGDLGGAVSITIPAGIYQRGVNENTLRTVALFVFLLSMVLGAGALFFRRNVTAPIARLEDAMEEMGKGHLEVSIGDAGHSRELNELMEGVEAMASELHALYTTLEEKVDSRTRQYREANALLEEQRKQIEHANEMLVMANRKLQQENEYRTNIIAILGHELRTPLTAILAFIDLWETSGGEHSEEEADCIEKVKFHSLSLLETVNNMLDMARVESGALLIASDEVDLVDLFEAIIAIAEPIARSKNIEISSAISGDVPIIRGDWTQIEKIMGNLLSNAVKFTDEGGHVVLRADFDAQEECVTLSVQDDGIGIAEESQRSIFDRFVQADASISRKYRGSGLGLSLVKKTAEMLGGKVRVDSELGVGSLFTVTLPVGVVKGDELDEDTDCR